MTRRYKAIRTFSEFHLRLGRLFTDVDPDGDGDFLKAILVGQHTLHLGHALLIGQTRPQELEQQILLVARVRVVLEGHPVVVVLVHLFQGDLHQLLNALIWVLVRGLLDDAGLEEVEHLLPRDEAVAVHVVDVKAEG